MLFDLGWSEILLIGTVALVFIGPKDLPKALRVAGYWVRKARTLSREFQSGIDQMIREAELDDMRQQLKKASEFNFEKEFNNTIDPTGSLAESLKPPALPDFSATAAAPAVADHSATTIAPAVALSGSTQTAAAAGSGISEMISPYTEAGTDPVPMVPVPESEPDMIPAAEPPTPTTAPPVRAAHSFVPPTP